MSKVNVAVPLEVHKRMKKVKVNTGIPISQQILQAFELWIKTIKDGKG